jgi:hypothetical protein
MIDEIVGKGVHDWVDLDLLLEGKEVMKPSAMV